MKILEYRVVPVDKEYQKVTLPKDVSWEMRFYCDTCDEEIMEDETTTHVCEDNQ